MAVISKCLKQAVLFVALAPIALLAVHQESAFAITSLEDCYTKITPVLCGSCYELICRNDRPPFRRNLIVAITCVNECAKPPCADRAGQPQYFPELPTCEGSIDSSEPAPQLPQSSRIDF